MHQNSVFDAEPATTEAEVKTGSTDSSDWVDLEDESRPSSLTASAAWGETTTRETDSDSTGRYVTGRYDTCSIHTCMYIHTDIYVYGDGED